MKDAEKVRQLLRLVPLMPEGGHYIETYRSDLRLVEGAVPGLGSGRALSTAMYYLLAPETRSALHRLPWDEVWHFYLGDPVDMLLLFPDGRGERILLGTDLDGGMRPQTAVPGGVWQGARLAPGGRFALLGTTMAPGFDPSDYEPGPRDALVETFGSFRDLILLLTESPC